MQTRGHGAIRQCNMCKHCQENFKLVACLILNLGSCTFKNFLQLSNFSQPLPFTAYSLRSYGLLSTKITWATGDPARCSEPSHLLALVIFDTAHMLPDEGTVLKPKTSRRIDLNYFRDSRVTAGSQKGFSHVTAARGSKE